MNPIDMVLHCPSCHHKHVDRPELGGLAESPWMNPPHRSHLCHRCGTVWRPADVATNGVVATKTRGSNDFMRPYAIPDAPAAAPMAAPEQTDFATMRKLVINGGAEAARRDAYIAWVQQCMRDNGMCIDGGKCGHACDPKGECFRTEVCVPLSGSTLTDDWTLPKDAAQSTKKDGA